ncbi:antibiotic biosynthesis monooxygenase [Luteipulveratus halotolerans]|uniref:Antibiotic biosynthesis monooxygenase n=1 Tax=Luteipulveratus halotolerans TaxID=1631356 RepID=A0A0L6CGE0_9MICO|nr:antibiotic biosynthesis monooxygenase [Luteipulveratus halotolerans]KNX36867.1 antibiotic biosynthesis monooxygenase [Luteipulveratus halotolerans]
MSITEIPLPATESRRHSVTVSITRRVSATDETAMLAWVRAGTSMAERFPGFLGCGWVRPTGDSDEWHMLYRFADEESLHRWEGSAERSWWLRSGEGLVEHTLAERRTGVEGWFDEPVDVSLQTLVTAPSTPPAPPRWKQALIIWMTFFPLNLLATVTIGHLIQDWNVVLRVLVLTAMLTPVMTYLLLPAMTRALAPWLHAGRPWGWRRGED